MPIEVTDNAFKKIASLIEFEKQKDLVLRITVIGGGCSGFSYNYSFIKKDEISIDDTVLTKDTVKIVIDKISINLMKDCIIDYVEELDKSCFEIKNFIAKSKCGCGNSFSL